MLRPDAAREHEGELALEVRLPWYRSLPFSCVEALELSVDGEPVPADELRVIVKAQERRLGELRWLDDETWFVRDPIVVRAPRAVAPGAPIDVRVALRVRIPYILAGPATPLSQTTERSERLVVQTGRPGVDPPAAGPRRSDRASQGR